MSRALALAFALAGPACWSTPQAPRGAALPGLLWITPAAPWRLRSTPTAIVVDGDTAIVGGAEGWLARLDLTTGAIVRETRLARTLTLYDLARLRDGRWIAVGVDAGVTRAVIVDRDLGTTPITLGVVPDRSLEHAGVAVLADGGVVIAGKGLPLAVYDPTTWSIRTVLAAELGWNRPRIHGATLGITLGAVAFAFDLATGVRTQLGPAATIQATSRRVALKVYDGGRWLAELWEDGKKVARLDREISALALDAAGDRLAVTSGSALLIYDLPALVPTTTIDLGAGMASVIGLLLDGSRAIVSTRAGVRVVELGMTAPKVATVSPIGAPPWGDPVGLEVGDDGTVLDLEPEHAWWLVGGKVVLERPLDGRIAATRHGEVERYATRRDAAPEHTVGLFGRAGELARWQLPDPLRVWVGAQDQLVVETMFSADEPSHLDRALPRALPDKSLAPIVRFTADGDVRDLDPQGDVAIGAGGQIFLVRVADGVRPAFTLRAPGCAEDAGVSLERAGPRAAVHAGAELAAWDRTTGALIAAVRFDQLVTAAVFVPRREVLVELAHGVALVDLGARTARVLDVPAYVRTALSPNGTRLVVAFGDGRLALFDVDALRATLAAQPLASFVMPAGCRGPDPFAVEPPGDTVIDFD